MAEGENDEERVRFKMSVIEEILKSSFEDKEKTKVNKDALKGVIELLRIFVSECVLRCIEQAENQGDVEVTLDHFEKVLPQLLLDF